MNRREALTGATAVVAAGGATSAAQAAAAGGFDIAGPGGRQRTYMMVKGALDDRLVIRWIATRYYAVIEATIQPMYNTHAATFSRYRRIADGPYADGYEMVTGELAWVTDPVSGKAIDRWHNPFIGREVTIPSASAPPSRLAIDRDLSIHLEHAAGGIAGIFEVLPFEVRGNDLWITERVRTAAVPGDKAFQYSQNSIYRTTLSAVSKPGAKHVESDISFTNICSWRPYLQMGDHPGHMISMGSGKHGTTFSSIPEEWKNATRERRPEIFNDPAGLLTPLWRTPAAWR